MSRQKQPIGPDTWARIRELLAYQPTTGHLTWRVDRGRSARKGDEAGSVRHDPDPRREVVIVTVDGRPWLAHRLIWFWVYGELPPGRLCFADGDTQNLKLDNIVTEEEARPEPSPMALYQRQLRKRRRELILNGRMLPNREGR